MPTRQWSIGQSPEEIASKRETLSGLRDALLDDNLDVRTEYEILALPEVTRFEKLPTTVPNDPREVARLEKLRIDYIDRLTKRIATRSTRCLAPSRPGRRRTNESNRSEPGVASLF